MDDGRVRQNLEFLVLRKPVANEAPLVRVEGTYTEWEDGRWRVDLPGYPPFFGTKTDGNGALVVALLSLRPQPSSPSLVPPRAT